MTARTGGMHVGEDAYDVVVVGAGPAGACAARAAAAAGRRVLVVERKAVVGRPVQCGEWVPQVIGLEVRLPRQAVVRTVRYLHTAIWVGDPPRVLDEAVLLSPGHMLDREAFDAALAQAAVDTGVTLWTGTRATGLEPGGVRLRRDGRELSVRARIVIGADGPLSTVGRQIGLANRDVVVALQYELPLGPGFPPDRRQVDIVFHPDLAGGYAWFFPKASTANVGAGASSALGRAHLRAFLHRYVAELARAGLVRPGPVRGATAGLIPVGGALPALHRGGVLLAGDAAGLAHPLTGAGILQAVVSGRLAGEAAAAASAPGAGVRQREAALAQYEEEVRERFGEYLSWAAARREERDRQWRVSADDEEVFLALVRRSWVAWPEYRAESGTVTEAGFPARL